MLEEASTHETPAIPSVLSTCHSRTARCPQATARRPYEAAARSRIKHATVLLRLGPFTAGIIFVYIISRQHDAQRCRQRKTRLSIPRRSGPQCAEPPQARRAVVHNRKADTATLNPSHQRDTFLNPPNPSPTITPGPRCFADAERRCPSEIRSQSARGPTQCARRRPIRQQHSSAHGRSLKPAPPWKSTCGSRGLAAEAASPQPRCWVVLSRRNERARMTMTAPAVGGRGRWLGLAVDGVSGSPIRSRDHGMDVAGWLSLTVKGTRKTVVNYCMPHARLVHIPPASLRP
ncbi:uncharacterized protein CC84DRAFT_1171968 [Paraphaeosphaeria sporulosa]|uniref:Uncharacterized protein n=1 Tax=Paraphaeosphaeria sporulosa TaxID=1460663 RepID=A0A177CPC9_9PLEO|nr:uncharacterized protein CC84DRAFT_1171968 [Paraphaeosphaeria sporulosa]OAG09383.1 hypothetical protein CC84DRAFT_1171968 [Paraphaeosphaeria sporulosa]